MEENWKGYCDTKILFKKTRVNYELTFSNEKKNCKGLVKIGPAKASFTMTCEKAPQGNTVSYEMSINGGPKAGRYPVIIKYDSLNDSEMKGTIEFPKGGLNSGTFCLQRS